MALIKQFGPVRNQLMQIAKATPASSTANQSSQWEIYKALKAVAKASNECNMVPSRTRQLSSSGRMHEHDVGWSGCINLAV
jgi:hypothetical protein